MSSLPLPDESVRADLPPTDQPGPRRVLLVTHYYPPHVGGIEYVAQNQARQLTGAGLDVAVLTSSPGGWPGTATGPDGVAVTRVPAWNGFERWGVPFPVFSPSILVRAARLVRAADVVHVHDVLYSSSWLVALWCWLLRTPLVVTQHVQLVAHDRRAVEYVQRAVYGTLGRLTLRRARSVSVLNAGVRAFVQRLGVPPTRVTVLPNGVDADQFAPVEPVRKAALRTALGLPSDGTLALFVGRLVPKKGFHLLLSAASDRYTLVIVGGDRPGGLAPDQRVVFLGALPPDQVRLAYQACDLFVLPSEAEGFPLTVQEAMASGLPVVTSDDPGYAVYGFDRTGIRLIRRDAAAVRDALTTLAADPAERARMAAYSLAYAGQNFRWPAHVQRLRALYAAALGQRR